MFSGLILFEPLKEWLFCIKLKTEVMTSHFVGLSFSSVVACIMVSTSNATAVTLHDKVMSSMNSSRTVTAVDGLQSAAEYVVPTSDIYSTSLTLTWARPSCSSRLTDFPPYRPRSTICRPATLVAVLLLLAGDVPLNPGPTTNSPAQIPSKFAPRNYKFCQK